MNLRQRLACLALAVSSTVCAAPAVANVGPFEFHSDFWLNLHHFLYEQALHSHETLTGEDKVAWDKALAFYRHSIVQHDLLRELRMLSIDIELAEDETLPKLVGNDEETELWQTLNSVAAIYRTHWWTNHDQANRAFVAAAVPLVQRYGPTLIKQLTVTYEASWPKDLIRVDVSEYANWAGAYTFTSRSGQVHEIVSSADLANRGEAALEVLFHEASHGFVGFDSGRLAEELTAASKSHGIPIPKDLVHVFIFYTAGELTRRDLGDNYIPYADKKRLYQDKWAPWHSRIEIYWKQHIDGTLSLSEAVNKIVK